MAFFIYFVIFPTVAYVSFPNSLNVSLEQRAANEDVMILFQTNASTAEDEITEWDSGDAIGEGAGTARGRDGGNSGNGGDSIGTSSCSIVIGEDGSDGGTAEAGTDVEVGQEGRKGRDGVL
jgi:hypothetical protein